MENELSKIRRYIGTLAGAGVLLCLGTPLLVGALLFRLDRDPIGAIFCGIAGFLIIAIAAFGFQKVAWDVDGDEGAAAKAKKAAKQQAAEQSGA